MCCFCLFLFVCFFVTNFLFVCVTNPGAGREPLHRRLDVYKLEASPPLDTLPFISHTTNNISKDFYMGESEFALLVLLV